MIATVALASALSVPASATVLLGKSIGIQYIYPDISAMEQDLGSNLVGTDGPTPFDPYFKFSFTDTTATTSNFQFAAAWGSAPFNGFRLYDVNGTIAAFTSVTINPSSNLLGLDASRITFDANNIYVNWDGLSVSASTFVTLNISGAVPEPASWALMIAGFGMVGFAARRRRAVVAA